MHEAVVVCIGRKSLRSFLARGTTKERLEMYGKHTGATDLCAASILLQIARISPRRFNALLQTNRRADDIRVN